MLRWDNLHRCILTPSSHSIKMSPIYRSPHQTLLYVRLCTMLKGQAHNRFHGTAATLPSRLTHMHMLSQAAHVASKRQTGPKWQATVQGSLNRPLTDAQSSKLPKQTRPCRAKKQTARPSTANRISQKAGPTIIANIAMLCKKAQAPCPECPTLNVSHISIHMLTPGVHRAAVRLMYERTRAGPYHSHKIIICRRKRKNRHAGRKHKIAMLGVAHHSFSLSIQCGHSRVVAATALLG